MKINLGNKPLIYPQPVLVIATYNEDKTANAMTAAWGSVFDYTKVSISLKIFSSDISHSFNILFFIYWRVVMPFAYIEIIF